MKPSERTKKHIEKYRKQIGRLQNQIADLNHHLITLGEKLDKELNEEKSEVEKE